MPLLRRRRPLLSVVVPAYDVEDYLPACLDSLLAQTYEPLEIIVVDDGSPDRSGEVADRYAAEHADIVRVLHTANGGLGAARNAGTAVATGELLAFADSDDVVPPDAYSVLFKQLQRGGCEFVTGSIARWEGDRLLEPRWMRRLHPRRVAFIDQHPEILGDVFAWNKLFRRSFWDRLELAWPEGVRYEDQPTLTTAYLQAHRFGVVPDVVYHWRIRDDGTSITQQRSSVADLRDRWRTKEMALDSVEQYGDPRVSTVFRQRVLPGDLHRYFTEIPGCTDEWWVALQTGVVGLWGREASLADSILPPVHRLCGWLVEHDRRDDAAALMAFVADHPGPLPRRRSSVGLALDVRAVPGLDAATIPERVLSLKADEG
ncbi:glycosyltransferase family 2 protein [Nocardioides acrostichi]|uniref:Glycosyltransferase n=1 Tax=Nocardioides acrostichi TaxID=2784339 RepID=A0A930V231_9ACTN|nr:glycosyltransferase family 2 protein [Nocardioides acrostichi]MBF4162614.1 glycosyltransferase [Nocardioides acrostichi]